MIIKAQYVGFFTNTKGVLATVLNAFPLKVPEVELTFVQIPYKRQLYITYDLSTK